MCTIEGLEIVRQICLISELNNKFEDNVDDLVVVLSGPSSTVVRSAKIMAHHTCKHAKLGGAGAWLIFGGEKIIFSMLYTHDECLQMMCIVLRARVMILVRSRLHVVTSITWDSHEIRTSECILRHGSL